MANRLVFWDWNNTLLDDLWLWRLATKEIFIRLGKPDVHFTIREFYEKFGGDYLGPYRAHGITEPREVLDKIYYDYLVARLDEAGLFLGVPETLANLERQGVTMALLTANPDELVHPLLRKFDIERHFRYIECSSLDKQWAIKRLREKEGVPPEECFIVGDSPSDIRHGNRAGIQSVAFLHPSVPGSNDENVPEDLVQAANPRHTILGIPEVSAIVL